MQSFRHGYWCLLVRLGIGQQIELLACRSTGGRGQRCCRCCMRDLWCTELMGLVRTAGSTCRLRCLKLGSHFIAALDDRLLVLSLKFHQVAQQLLARFGLLGTLLPELRRGPVPLVGILVVVGREALFDRLQGTDQLVLDRSVELADPSARLRSFRPACVPVRTIAASNDAACRSVQPVVG